MASSGGGAAATDDSGAVSPSSIDKRRSKLGYQRISVACSHCRRRKIRCAMQENDPQGRCSNCIKLKKECIFNPVEASNAQESRAQSRQGLNPKASSSMTRSPSSVGTQSVEGGEREPQRLMMIPSNAPAEGRLAMEPPGIIGSTGPADFSYQHSLSSDTDQRADWQNRSFSVSNQPYPPEQQWRGHDIAGPEQYGQFPHGTQAPFAGAMPYHYAPPPQQVYSTPLRSVSWGEAERPQYSGSFAPPISASTAHGQGISFAGQYSHAEGQQAHTASPIAYPGAPQGYIPIGVAPEQWQHYNQAPGYMGSMRHDSANSAWVHGMPHIPGVDPNYSVHSEGSDQYKRGGNQAG